MKASYPYASAFEVFVFALASLFVVAPTAKAAPPEKHKYVTIAYLTWADFGNRLYQCGLPAPYDTGRCDNPAGSLPDVYQGTETGGGTCPVMSWHWWGKPQIFGGDWSRYNYLVDGMPNNELIDRHMDLISAAGIDFITIDYSNGNVGPFAAGTKEALFNAATHALLTRITQRVAQAKPTPKVAFFNAGDHQALKDIFYSKYPASLFFTVGGKPLLMAGDCDATVPSAFTCKPIQGLRRYGAGVKWSFKETSPQTPYWNSGWPEEVAVHPIESVGPVNICLNGPGQNRGRENGWTFARQWAAGPKTNNPSFVYVSTWNEWGAFNLNAPNDGLAGLVVRIPAGGIYPDNRPFFVDQWNQEFSTDFEPMFGGHGDSYYRALAVQIADYKRNTPNFAFRDRVTGMWRFKYHSGAPELSASNFTSSFQWAAGSHYQPFVGDFDGDGYADIGLRNTQNGWWHFARRVGPNQYANTDTFGWAAGAHYQPFVGDFNGDGHVDIGLRDTTTGTWHFALRVAPYAYAHNDNFGWAAGANFEPFAGDFDGDGRLDIGLRNRDNGRWHIAQRVGPNYDFANNKTIDWTPGSDVQPFFGHFDSDRYADMGLRNIRTGELWTRNGSSNLSFSNTERYRGWADQNIDNPYPATWDVLVMPSTAKR